MDDFSDIIFPTQDTVLNSNFVDAAGMPYASIVSPSDVLKSTSLLCKLTYQVYVCSYNGFVQIMEQLQLAVCCIKQYQNCCQTTQSSNECLTTKYIIRQIVYVYSNRNDTTRVASMVLSTQILGGVSFAQDQFSVELNFQLTVSRYVAS